MALAAPLAMTLRWLEVLPLGAQVSGALGLPVPAVRAALMALSALLTGAAALIVGPLSFIGLVAPHAVYAAGLTKPGPHLAGAMLAGAALLVAADALARMVVFPYQLPLGLFASLIGGGYLVLALARR